MRTSTLAGGLALAILLSGCGPAATSATSAPSTPAGSAAGATGTAAPTQSAQAAQTAKGAAGAPAALAADAACRLVTTEEVAAAFGVTGVKAEPTAVSGKDDGDGVVQYDCWYRTSGGDAVLAMTYTVVSATAGMTADDLAAMVRGGNATTVPGVDAAWEDSRGTLVVILRKGQVVVLQVSSSPDKHAVLVQNLAAIVSRRM